MANCPPFSKKKFKAVVVPNAYPQTSILTPMSMMSTSPGGQYMQNTLPCGPLPQGVCPTNPGTSTPLSTIQSSGKRTQRAASKKPTNIRYEYLEDSLSDFDSDEEDSCSHRKKKHKSRHYSAFQKGKKKSYKWPKSEQEMKYYLPGSSMTSPFEAGYRMGYMARYKDMLSTSSRSNLPVTAYLNPFSKESFGSQLTGDRFGLQIPRCPVVPSHSHCPGMPSPQCPGMSRLSCLPLTSAQCSPPPQPQCPSQSPSAYPSLSTGQCPALPTAPCPATTSAQCPPISSAQCPSFSALKFSPSPKCPSLSHGQYPDAQCPSVSHLRSPAAPSAQCSSATSAQYPTSYPVQSQTAPAATPQCPFAHRRPPLTKPSAPQPKTAYATDSAYPVNCPSCHSALSHQPHSPRQTNLTTEDKCPGPLTFDNSHKYSTYQDYPQKDLTSVYYPPQHLTYRKEPATARCQFEIDNKDAGSDSDDRSGVRAGKRQDECRNYKENPIYEQDKRPSMMPKFSDNNSYPKKFEKQELCSKRQESHNERPPNNRDINYVQLDDCPAYKSSKPAPQAPEDASPGLSFEHDSCGKQSGGPCKYCEVMSNVMEIVTKYDTDRLSCVKSEEGKEAARQLFQQAAKMRREKEPDGVNLPKTASGGKKIEL